MGDFTDHKQKSSNEVIKLFFLDFFFIGASATKKNPVLVIFLFRKGKAYTTGFSNNVKSVLYSQYYLRYVMRTK